MNRVARKRRSVFRAVSVLFSAAFRCSVSRDAYVLRGIGNRRGPVLKAKVAGGITQAGDRA